ncbi:MAG TPA: hypothetical protein VJK49_04080 [Candidatus Limnocylindrales bacterium]|nr:hypothetical protein [Candidatus Limnocylindrales bacterium]
MLPNLSIVWIIAFVLLLTVILDRLLFRPITRVIQERERRIGSARELAEQAAAKAEAAGTEYEERTAAARSDVYRHMDDIRRAALKRRADLLAETRNEASAAIAEAAAQVEVEARAARAALARETEALGREAAERILGQKVS